MTKIKYKIYIYWQEDMEVSRTRTWEWHTVPTIQDIDTLCTSILREDSMAHEIRFTTYSISKLTITEETVEDNVHF